LAVNNQNYLDCFDELPLEKIEKIKEMRAKLCIYLKCVVQPSIILKAGLTGFRQTIHIMTKIVDKKF
jgi:hypothetical protein